MKRVDRKAQTRRALLDAAVEEFGRHGFRGARVESIAAAAGVTTGALYTHFRSKEDLFLAVYDLFTTRIVDEVAVLAGVLDQPAPGNGADRADAGLPPIDPAGRRRDLAGALDAWLAWHAADPRGFRLSAEFLLSVPDLPRLRDDVVLRRRRARARLAQWLVALAEQRGRRLTVPPEELALHIHGLAIGMVLEQLGDPDVVVEGRFGRWVEAIVTNYTEERS